MKHARRTFFQDYLQEQQLASVNQTRGRTRGKRDETKRNKMGQKHSLICGGRFASPVNAGRYSAVSTGSPGALPGSQAVDWPRFRDGGDQNDKERARDV